MRPNGGRDCWQLDVMTEASERKSRVSETVMMKRTQIARRRAARGARALDRIAGCGWADRLSADLVDQANARRCVIGALYGPYNDSAEPWRLTGRVLGRRWLAVRRGFRVRGEWLCGLTSSTCRCVAGYKFLTWAWRDEIRTRQGGNGSSLSLSLSSSSSSSSSSLVK